MISSVIHYCKDLRQHEIDLFYATKEWNVVNGDVVSENHSNACIIHLIIQRDFDYFLLKLITTIIMINIVHSFEDLHFLGVKSFYTRIFWVGKMICQ